MEWTRRAQSLRGCSATTWVWRFVLPVALRLPTQLPYCPSPLPLLSCQTGRRAQGTRGQVHKTGLLSKCNCQHSLSKHNWRRMKSDVSFWPSGYGICLGNGSSSQGDSDPVTHIYLHKAVRRRTFTLPWWSLVLMPPPLWRGKNQVPKRRQPTSPTASRSTSMMWAHCNLAIRLALPLLLPTSTLGPP